MMNIQGHTKEVKVKFKEVLHCKKKLSLSYTALLNPLSNK